MKTKFNGILTLLLALIVQVSFAQEKTVSGTVSDESGSLLGVSILIKGTTTGSETDFDGNYSIRAKSGDVLVYSYLGYKTVEKTVGISNTINVTLEEDANVLEEIVIVGQGIRREQKALGYSVATVKSDVLEQKPEADIAKLLTGKVAGVQVNTGGGFLGTATNVIIRSKNSISGNNQPLYIIDGAPISGDRSYDIDPNNIASTTVLKGLAASTLYGQDGRNGVIIINTKTGSGKAANKKFEVDVSFTTGFLEVSNLPDYQNTYGQGSDNGINTTFFGNWGAKFDNQEVPHHLNIPGLAASFPEYQGATDIYRAIPNNVSDFFSTGALQTVSVIARKSFDKGNFSVSFGNTEQTGYLEENTFNRYNIAIGGSMELANNLTFSSNIQYTKNDNNRPSRNFFQLVTWIPRNLDIHNLPFQDPNNGSSVYYRTTISNPRWTRANTGFQEDTDRAFITLGVDYKINDNLDLKYLYSLDNVSTLNTDYQNKDVNQQDLGFFQTFTRTARTTTHRISLNSGASDLGNNFSYSYVLGSEIKNLQSNFVGVTSTDQVVFDFLNHGNFRNASAIDSRNNINNTIGAYGSLNVNYKKDLYLTLSARNDWGSTVEKDNRSILYPSVSLSYIPTETFDWLKGDKNNFLKMRAGFGTSANFPSAYLTQLELEATANAFLNPFSGGITSTNSLSSFLPNPDIKPELLKEFEVGIEGRLWNNFLDFDISAYSKIVEDQILFSSRAASTGTTQTVINAGRVDTDGVEARVSLNLFRSNEEGGFNWTMDNNFTAYETTVVDLPVEQVNISSGVNFAIEGESYGVFRGSFAARDDNGNLLINPSTGKIISSDDLGLEDKLIGDPNEDWSYSNINSFSYKNFTLSAQWEYIHGGDIYSVTASNLLRRGVTTDTETNREGSYIIPGVLADPNTGDVLKDANGQSINNTIQIGANDLYFINLQDVDENLVYDASTVRLRDVSLSYKMSKKSLEKTPFGSLTFTASGNNLWYKAYNIPAGLNLDPEVISSGQGNGRGLDFQNDPSYKTYSFSVKATF
ncbi:SusC/RagA family TonB-linked outer membrane protein [Polaribacter sp.]|jgi:TonB-linked SusC/RagA family outer membrane protein|uniref:SusC/RagA family TonB-linked outer membrane protein n=1 Tax=Polaribacter sp. TaxID=1920175 RepID=UPI0026309081|nr:SusC/RagA family TonB-linked outer membrane protein [Polaribacter sp.]MDG1404387.1 SusC/RagA family TonB-linked outer membrane protein [Polaribacter sp.]